MLMLITVQVYIPPDINDFNTSHVNVNLQPCYSSLDNQAYFNTSHVNVNPTNLSLFNHA